MPIAMQEGAQVVTGLKDVQTARPEDITTFADQTRAAFQLENTAVAAFQRLTREEFEDEANFNPADHLRPGEELVQSQFSDAGSRAEMDAIRKRIQEETEARKRLGEGPLPELLASTLAVAGDPLSYLPGFAGLGLRGASAGTKVVGIGLGSAADNAVAEAVLHSNQETRTLTESAVSIMLGGVFGLTVGGAIAGTGARTATKEAQAQAVQDFIAVAEDQYPGHFGGGTAGAAQVRRLTPEETEIKSTGRVAEGLAKLKKVGLAAPSLELSTSRFAKSREFSQRLVDTGLITKGNVEGLASAVSVETRIKRVDADIGAYARMLHDAHKAHKRAGGTMNKREFFAEVGRANRRGDQHTDPFVDQAAKTARRTVYDPYKKEASGIGLLPEDVEVTTAASYFSRVYDRERIKARRPEFRTIVSNWLRRNVDPDALATADEVDDIADNIIDQIIGAPSGRVPFVKAPLKRGPLKERTFNIPDEDIEDFLEADALNVGTRYLRTMAADIEMQREFGTTTLDKDSDIIKQLQEEAREQIEKASTEKERLRIQKDADREAAVIQALSENVRGTFGNRGDASYIGLRRAGKVVRNLNYLRLLGSVLLSSIPDMGRIVMEEGLARTVGGFMADAATGFKGIRMAVNEAQMAGTALDIVLSTRARAIMDLGDRYVDESKFERGISALSDNFGMVTMLNPWNQALKGVTSAMAGTRILQTAQKLAKGEKLSKIEVQKLARAGIGETEARLIAKQSGKWEKNGTIILGNTEEWTDQAAVNAFRNALLQDVDRTIITPGSGDAPLWTSTDWGKTVFQFKRFAAASTQRILLSGLQQRDMAALNGFLVMAALGGLGTAARDITRQGSVTERSPEQWAVDAVDRSGAISLFVEMDNIVDEVSGGNVSLQRALTGAEASRFAGRDILGTLVGPSVGLVEDVGNATRNVLDGEISRKDLHRVRKLVPGQNIFYLRWMLDQMEKGAANELGLPETG